MNKISHPSGMPVPERCVCEKPEEPAQFVVGVAGESCTIPKGSVAPGNVCPCPPVPMKGFTQRVKSFVCAPRVKARRRIEPQRHRGAERIFFIFVFLQPPISVGGYKTNC